MKTIESIHGIFAFRGLRLQRMNAICNGTVEEIQRGACSARQHETRSAMTNLYIHTPDSKSHASDRGSPRASTYPGSANPASANRGSANRGFAERVATDRPSTGQASTKTGSAAFRPEDFLLLSDSAVTATIAMHEAWARNWSCWNRFYKETYEFFQPYYMFPLEMAQQYSAFVLGCQRCISEPIGKQQRRSPKGPGPRLARVVRVEEDEREELELAMDIAIGAASAPPWADAAEAARSAAA